MMACSNPIQGDKLPIRFGTIIHCSGAGNPCARTYMVTDWADRPSYRAVALMNLVGYSGEYGPYLVGQRTVCNLAPGSAWHMAEDQPLDDRDIMVPHARTT